MEIEDFIKKFEDAIDGVQQGSLSAKTNFKNDIVEWDSLSVLTTLAMIDKEFNIILNQKVLEDVKTIEDLFNYIKIKQC